MKSKKILLEAGLISSLLLSAGCGEAPHESDVQAQEVTNSTTVVTVTESAKNRPDLDCQPPVVDQFEMNWERNFGPGIPPKPQRGESSGHDYFASYSPRTANVTILNLSPHKIYVRGVNIQMSWMDPDRTIYSNRYRRSMPYQASAGSDIGLVPDKPDRSGTERKARGVPGGQTITLERDYIGGWEAHVAGGGEPFTWIEPESIDWWFADEEVRRRCDQ